MKLLQKSHPFVVSCLLKLTLGLQIFHRLVIGVDDGFLSHQGVLSFLNKLH